MSEKNLKTLQPVLKSFDGESWVRLDPFLLSIFRSMHARKINFSVLHVVAEFWDAKDHIFRFNMVELYPLPEEFEAILGSQSNLACQLTTPPFKIPDLQSISIKWPGCSIFPLKHHFVTYQALLSQ